MTVEVNRNVRADPLLRAPDEIGHRLGARDPDRVDDDRLVRTGFDRRLVDGLEVPRVRTRAVHAEERDRHALLDCERDRVDDPLEHRLAVDTERCELQVGDRRLDHARLDAELDESLDVRVHRTRETPDLRVQSGIADQLDRVPVVFRDARKAGLDPLDAELVETARELELVLGTEHDPDRLLAVAQRRVVEADLRGEAMRIVELAGPERSSKIVRVARQLLGTVSGDEEVVLDAQAPSALPVRTGLDRQHHSLLDRAAAGLMRVGGSCARAPTPWAIGCDGWPGYPASSSPARMMTSSSARLAPGRQ